MKRLISITITFDLDVEEYCSGVEEPEPITDALIQEIIDKDITDRILKNIYATSNHKVTWK